MSSAKFRLAAAGGAGLFGIVGVAAIGISLALALVPVIGPVAATGLVGGVFFLLSAICLVIVADPDATTEEEVSRLETLTAEALADLPFDTMKAVIEKRPIASLAIAATTGYALSKDPENAARHLRRAMTGLM